MVDYHKLKQVVGPIPAIVPNVISLLKNQHSLQNMVHIYWASEYVIILFYFFWIPSPFSSYALPLSHHLDKSSTIHS